jgi:hypothetical protein
MKITRHLTPNHFDSASPLAVMFAVMSVAMTAIMTAAMTAATTTVSQRILSDFTHDSSGHTISKSP